MQPYLRNAWLIADCFKQSEIIGQACGPPGRHATWNSFRNHGNRAHPLTHHIFLTSPLYMCHPLLKSIKRISKILWLWHLCELPDHQVSSQVSQSILWWQQAKCQLAVNCWPRDEAFYQGSVLGGRYYFYSLCFPPSLILICKHRGLTHHCDFCLHYMLFWAEVSQDTMWLQPNLASHSVPELNHLCVCFKYSLMVLPQFLGFFSLFSVSCVISERILPFWISRNNPKLILTLANEVRLQW